MQGREEGRSWAEQVEEEEIMVEEEAAEGRPKPATKRRVQAKNKSSDAEASRLGKDRQTGKNKPHRQTVTVERNVSQMTVTS